MITPADTPPSAPEQMPVSTFDMQAPYAPGSPQSLQAGPMGDDVAGTVAAAQAAAESRYTTYMQQTYNQGSSIGVQVDLPDVVSDHSLTTGGDGAGHPFEES